MIIARLTQLMTMMGGNIEGKSQGEITRGNHKTLRKNHNHNRTAYVIPINNTYSHSIFDSNKQYIY
jgi:hypothetical protein